MFVSWTQKSGLWLEQTISALGCETVVRQIEKWKKEKQVLISRFGEGLKVWKKYLNMELMSTMMREGMWITCTQ